MLSTVALGAAGLAIGAPAAQASINIDDVSVTETNGNVDATFTITRSCRAVRGGGRTQLHERRTAPLAHRRTSSRQSGTVALPELAARWHADPSGDGHRQGRQARRGDRVLRPAALRPRARQVARRRRDHRRRRAAHHERRRCAGRHRGRHRDHPDHPERCKRTRRLGPGHDRRRDRQRRPTTTRPARARSPSRPARRPATSSSRSSTTRRPSPRRSSDCSSPSRSTRHSSMPTAPPRSPRATRAAAARHAARDAAPPPPPPQPAPPSTGFVPFGPPGSCSGVGPTATPTTTSSSARLGIGAPPEAPRDRAHHALVPEGIGSLQRSRDDLLAAQQEVQARERCARSAARPGARSRSAPGAGADVQLPLGRPTRSLLLRAGRITFAATSSSKVGTGPSRTRSVNGTLDRSHEPLVGLDRPADSPTGQRGELLDEVGGRGPRRRCAPPTPAASRAP